jgi:hypothetical protein
VIDASNRGVYFVIESHRGCLNDRDTTLDAGDLDSALAWGGDIHDIADFLSRDVAEVERKAYERNLPEPAEKRQAAA